MSKYLMNKLIHRVNADEAALKAYRRDPAGFVAEWERSQPASAGRLTDEEREALATRDYGRLYALGAHPFMLWSFTEAVWSHEVPRDELVRDYKEKTAAIGYPDFAT